MSWVRLADEAATHEVVLRPLEWDDGGYQLKNELLGVMTACCTVVAAHKGDYVIRRGVFMTIAGPSWRDLEQGAVRAGYVTRVELEDGAQALRLVEDESLFHMISRAERDRNNQHRNDTRNPKLIIPVRVRDGDQCRYCGIVVNWGDRKGARGGTYDHRDPDQPATSPADLVVCCKTCNSARQNDIESFTRKLQDPPADPFYKTSTVEFLAKHGVTVQASDNRTPTTPATSGQANGAQAAAHSATTPAPAVQTPEQRPAPAPDPRPSTDAPEPPDTDPADSGRSRQIEAMTDQAVPGRDGTGRAGQVLDGSREIPPPPEESRHENQPADRPRPDDHRPGKRKRPRRRKKK